MFTYTEYDKMYFHCGRQCNYYDCFAKFYFCYAYIHIFIQIFAKSRILFHAFILVLLRIYSIIFFNLIAPFHLSSPILLSFYCLPCHCRVLPVTTGPSPVSRHFCHCPCATLATNKLLRIAHESSVNLSNGWHFSWCPQGDFFAWLLPPSVLVLEASMSVGILLFVFLERLVCISHGRLWVC